VHEIDEPSILSDVCSEIGVLIGEKMHMTPFSSAKIFPPKYFLPRRFPCFPKFPKKVSITAYLVIYSPALKATDKRFPATFHILSNHDFFFLFFSSTAEED